jgi:hypothetical protein
MKYKIMRYYYPDQNKPAKEIMSGLTLEEAREHCNNSRTRKEGVYFDGYTEE